MATIGLTKPSASDPVNLSTINGNWTKIEDAFGEIGTPTANNNVKILMDRESYSSRTGSGSSFSGALNAVTFYPYSNGSESLKTTCANAIAAFETAVGNATSNATSNIFTTATSGSGGTMYVGGVVAKYSGNVYAGMVFCTGANIAFFVRKTGTSSYYVKVL